MRETLEERFRQLVSDPQAVLEFEDSAPRARQSRLIFRADFLCLPQRIAHAAPMVVSRRFETGNRLTAHMLTVVEVTVSLYHNIS